MHHRACSRLYSMTSLAYTRALWVSQHEAEEMKLEVSLLQVCMSSIAQQRSPAPVSGWKYNRGLVDSRLSGTPTSCQPHYGCFGRCGPAPLASLAGPQRGVALVIRVCFSTQSF